MPLNQNMRPSDDDDVFGVVSDGGSLPPEDTTVAPSMDTLEVAAQHDVRAAAELRRVRSTRQGAPTDFLKDLPTLSFWTIHNDTLHCWHRKQVASAGLTGRHWHLNDLRAIHCDLPVSLKLIRQLTSHSGRYDVSSGDLLRAQLRHLCAPLRLVLEHNMASNSLRQYCFFDPARALPDAWRYCFVDRFLRAESSESADHVRIVATVYSTQSMQTRDTGSARFYACVEKVASDPVGVDVPVAWLDTAYSGWRDRYHVGAALGCEGATLEQALFYPTATSASQEAPTVVSLPPLLE